MRTQNILLVVPFALSASALVSPVHRKTVSNSFTHMKHSATRRDILCSSKDGCGLPGLALSSADMNKGCVVDWSSQPRTSLINCLVHDLVYLDASLALAQAQSGAIQPPPGMDNGAFIAALQTCLDVYNTQTPTPDPTNPPSSIAINESQGDTNIIAQDGTSTSDSVALDIRLTNAQPVAVNGNTDGANDVPPTLNGALLGDSILPGISPLSSGGCSINPTILPLRLGGVNGSPNSLVVLGSPAPVLGSGLSSQGLKASFDNLPPSNNNGAVSQDQTGTVDLKLAINDGQAAQGSNAPITAGSAGSVGAFMAQFKQNTELTTGPAA